MKPEIKSVTVLKKDFTVIQSTMKKYLKTKIKPYEGKINAGFYNYGMAEEGYHRVFLSVTLIDFVFKMAKNYCPHAHMKFLKIAKTFLKKKR